VHFVIIILSTLLFLVEFLQFAYFFTAAETFGLLNLGDFGLAFESNLKHVLIALTFSRSSLEFKLPLCLIMRDKVLISLPVEVESLVSHGLLSTVFLDPPLLEHVPFFGDMVLFALTLNLTCVLLPVEDCHRL